MKYLVIIAVLVGVLLLFLLIRWLVVPRRSGQIQSVAILRRTHLSIPETRLKVIVERALGPDREVVFIPIQPRDDGAELHGFVVDGEAYGVICVPRPYIGPEMHAEIRSTVRDTDVADALTTHGAWISVDYMRGTADEPRIYATIGRLIAELLDDEAMLLLDVAHNRFATIDEQTREHLRGPAPMGMFGTQEYVFAAHEDDQAIARAVDEARGRWDEFVIAWEKRTPDQHFAVKLAFEDGKRVEHMWVTVEDVSSSRVTGVLDNDPTQVRNIKIGARVDRDAAEVEDWLIVEEDGTMTGGFSAKALVGRGM